MDWRQLWPPVLVQVFVAIIVAEFGTTALLMSAPRELQAVSRKLLQLGPISHPKLVVLVVFLTIGGTALCSVPSSWLADANLKVLTTAVLAFALLLLAYSYWIAFKAITFDSVVAELDRRSLRLGEQGSKARKAHVLLGLLAELGEVASAGGEKRKVLRVLEKQFLKSGGKLVPSDETFKLIVAGITRTLLSVRAVADCDDYVAAFHLMYTLRRDAARRSRDQANRVATAERRLAQHLVQRILLEPSSGLAVALPEVVRSVERQPFELLSIGRKCASTFPTVVTIPAILLLARWIDDEPGRNDVAAYLIGLAASLRRTGANGRRWVGENLQFIVKDEQSLDTELETAELRLFQDDSGEDANAVAEWRAERGASEPRPPGRSSAFIFAPRFRLSLLG